MKKEPHDSSSDDELIFRTQGTSIEEAFGEYENDADVDETEEDDFSDNSWE